jgi:hypothetical protein
MKLLIKQFKIHVSVSDSPVSYTGNRFNYSYETRLNGKTLFKGKDFSPSPLDKDNPLGVLTGLLSFHCLQPGDTDAEYFEKYTPKQMAWAQSFECEQLKGLLQDFEDKNSEYYHEAFETLSKGLKP